MANLFAPSQVFLMLRGTAADNSNRRIAIDCYLYLHTPHSSNLWGQLKCTVGKFPDPSYQCKGLVPRPNMVHSHVPAAVPAATNEDEHCNQYCCSPNPNHYGNLVRAGGRDSVVHGACIDGACVHGEYRAKSVYRLLDIYPFTSVLTQIWF